MFGLLTTSTLTLSVWSITLLLLFPAIIGYRLHNSPVKNSPVILVPGDGGSQLEAKLDKPDTVHMFCDKKTNKYFNLWLNPNLLFPGVIDCWVDNMRLIYNHSSRTTYNSPGVDIRVPGFGNTTSVEWLDPSGMLPPFFRRVIMSDYFVDIVDMLVKEGYTRGVNVRGAPYDYRKAPNEMKEYFMDVKKLIEETYEINEQTKVTVICHSMGCPIISYFFNTQQQSWKETHVKGLISLGGAFAGAVKAMKTIASGENLGILIVRQTTLRTEQRTGSSLSYMLPSRLVWDADETLAFTSTRNYTVSNYDQFFSDINFTVAHEMYKDTHLLAEKGLQPPGIEVHCMYGQGLPTTERLDYSKEKSLPDKPALIMGDGDGTVNIRSLRACSRWNGQQKQQVTIHELPMVEHLKILSHPHLFKFLRHYLITW